MDQTGFKVRTKDLPTCTPFGKSPFLEVFEAQLQQLRYETSEDVVETEGEELRRSHSV